MGSHGRKIQTQYRTMSPEDQATFRRWVRLNAVVGFILAGGLIAMALAGNIGQSGMNAATAGTAGKVVAHAQAR